MPFVHGKSTDFQLDNAAGAIQTLSSYCESVDFPETLETHETTTFGASAKTYIVGLKDSSLSLSGKFDPTLDAHMNGVLAALAAGTLASASFVYGPAGTTTGNPKYSGEALLTDYSVSGSVGDLVTWSAELQITGAVTRGTY